MGAGPAIEMGAQDFTDYRCGVPLAPVVSFRAPVPLSLQNHTKFDDRDTATSFRSFVDQPAAVQEIPSMSLSGDGSPPDDGGSGILPHAKEHVELEKAESHTSVHTTAHPEIAPEPKDGNPQYDDESDPREFTEAQADAPDLERRPPHLFDEIRTMQERLRFLEEQAVPQWQSTPAGVDSEGTLDRNTVDKDEDDAEFRKLIRRAPSSKKAVEKLEKQAEATSDERSEHGRYDGTNPLQPTMYHLNRDGSMFQGTMGSAAHGQGRWQDERSWQWPRDRRLRLGDPAQGRPHHGFRPPTSLQPPPSYRQPEANSSKTVRLSRKLGPPTDWDMSDSEEWDSDGSTRSQDFNYFRARLRGDFEWELDRLNAQVDRYKKFKEKRARKLASSTENFASHEESQNDLTLSLNVVDWDAFRAARRPEPNGLLFVLDVLTEEPKILYDPRGMGRREGTLTLQEVQLTHGGKKLPQGPRVTYRRHRVDKKFENENNTTIHSIPLGEWNGQGSLPERVRIHSKSIIDILSAVSESRSVSYPPEDANAPASLVLLRPFTTLIVYDKNIRELVNSLTAQISQSKEENPVSETSDTSDLTEPAPSTSKPSSEDTKSTKAAKKSTKEDKPEDSHKTMSLADKELQLSHLTCLVGFMDLYISRKVDFLKSARCTRIFFSDAWYIFQPGTAVISADGKQAFKVVSLRSKRHKNVDRWASFRDPEEKPRSATGGDKSRGEEHDRYDLTIKCVFIHFDGRRLGPVLRSFGINKWDGEKDVTHLEVYPLRFHVQKGLTDVSPMLAADSPSEDAEGNIEAGIQRLREKLVARGKVFVSVAAVKQMYYAGLAINTRDEIESQVMIDFEEAFTSGRESWAPVIKRLVGTDWDYAIDKPDDACKADCCFQENIHNDFGDQDTINRDFINTMLETIKDTPQKLPSVMVFPRSLEDIRTEGNALADEELMIMSYSVFGFVLRDRTWSEQFPSYQAILDCHHARLTTGQLLQRSLTWIICRMFPLAE